jgi:hypothetical protein
MLVCLVAAMMAVATISTAAMAQLPIEFSEITVPMNPENTFGSFTFDDFSGAGAFTDGPNSLILDVQDFNGSNGIFGGAGVDYGTPPATNQRDFDPALAHWRVRLKILPLNAATAIRTTYIDHDGGFPVAAEEYVYEFDLTSVPNDGQFHVLTMPVTSPLFNQSAFGFDAADDGINNPGLRQVQIQSVFGSTGRLNVEVDFVRIVPEPASIGLLGLAMPAMLLAARRRRAA